MCARTLGRPDFNRLRVRFGKDGRLAYLGHLEVLNTIMRSVRRAQLPFLVGNGFAQRMRIQFSQVTLRIVLLYIALCGQLHDVVTHDGYHDDGYDDNDDDLHISFVVWSFSM